MIPHCHQITSPHHDVPHLSPLPSQPTRPHINSLLLKPLSSPPQLHNSRFKRSRPQLKRSRPLTNRPKPPRIEQLSEQPIPWQQAIISPPMNPPSIPLSPYIVSPAGMRWRLQNNHHSVSRSLNLSSLMSLSTPTNHNFEQWANAPSTPTQHQPFQNISLPSSMDKFPSCLASNYRQGQTPTYRVLVCPS